MPIARRDFMAGLGAAAAWPLAAHGQQPAMPVVGFLATAAPDRRPKTVQAFRLGLKDGGYVEGENVLVEDRDAGGQYDRLPALADEFVRRRVAVIVAGGVPATLATKATGTAIPVVFYMGGNPIQLGLIASLNRPGGNFTGITLLNTELGPKRLELLRGLVPGAASYALLLNPANNNFESQWRDFRAAAQALNVQLHLLRARMESEFDAVFAELPRLRAGGLVIGADGVFVSRSEQLGALSLRHKVPAIFQFADFATAGGLVSYGGSLADSYRQVGIYTARVLKGEKPADLPVQQSTKVEMIINLKTARALGITVPLPLLGRADEVIE
jgi:putative ABC transport system substrate-binding protein